MDLGPFKIYRFFYSGLRSIALPWILDLGPFKIQNPFLIKCKANFEYFLVQEMYNIYIKRKLMPQRFEKYKKLNFHKNGLRPF